MQSETLDKINRLSNLQFLLYARLGRRIANRAPGMAGWAYGDEPLEVRLIRWVSMELEELWKERRRERIGHAWVLIRYWDGWPEHWKDWHLMPRMVLR